MKKTALLFMTVLTAVLIFCFSAQDDAASNTVSKAVTKRVMTQKELLTNTGHQPTKAEISKVNRNIRSAAHFALYLFLAFFLYLLLKSCAVEQAALLCMAATVFYSFTDEFHQIFVPGRAFELSDLVKDWSGSLLGMTAAALTFFLYQKRNKKSDVSMR